MGVEVNVGVGLSVGVGVNVGVGVGMTRVGVGIGVGLGVFVTVGRGVFVGIRCGCGAISLDENTVGPVGDRTWSSILTACLRPNSWAYCCINFSSSGVGESLGIIIDPNRLPTVK